MRVDEVCTHEVIHVRRDASIREAAALMRRHHVGCVVVAEQPNGDRIPVGILTDRDIVVSVIAEGADVDALAVGDVMTRDPVTCSGRDDLADVLQAMRTRGIRRMPVVDSHSALVGMITSDDVLGAISSQLSELTGALTREQALEMGRRP